MGVTADEAGQGVTGTDRPFKGLGGAMFATNPTPTNPAGSPTFYRRALPGGASPTTPLLGVVHRPDGSTAAIGDTVDVVISGVYPVIAGGSISRKNLITSGGTDGTAIAESASAGTNVGVLGQAIEDGVSGDRVATVINPFIKQGG